MEGDHMQEINNLNVQINKMRNDHEIFVQKLEDNYNEKLIYEYNKFYRFETKMESLLQEHEQKYESLKKEKVESEETITVNYMQKLNDTKVHNEEVSRKLILRSNR